jgi:hypothetical protein
MSRSPIDQSKDSNTETKTQLPLFSAQLTLVGDPEPEILDRPIPPLVADIEPTPKIPASWWARREYDRTRSKWRYQCRVCSLWSKLVKHEPKACSKCMALPLPSRGRSSE